MKRMRTLLGYALLIVGFIFLSRILEEGLIQNMFEELVPKSVSVGQYGDVELEMGDASASSTNGSIRFTLKNTSDEPQDLYAKVNLYDDRGLLAATQYFDVHLDPQEEKDFLVKFKGNNIASYDVELIPASEVPDKSNIIDFFGYEFDMTDFFGMDLTNMSIFGVPLKDLLKWDNVKNAARSGWDWMKIFLARIPWWGYAIGAGIVLWHLPAGYLLGIFPL